MSDRFCRVPVTAEVNRFQTKVRGDKDFTAGRRAKNGTVVANAEPQGSRGGTERGGLGADGLDQGKFAGGAGW